MKRIILSMGVVALLLTGCNTQSGEQAPAQNPETKAVETVAKATYDEITDATTGATGMGGVKALNLTPAESVAKALEFLKKTPTFYIATAENGLPRVRPTGVMTFYQDKIWFHVGASKGVYKQIKKDSNVEVVALGENREWIRISGEAVCVDDAAVSNQALDARPHLKNMYNEKTGAVLGNFYFKTALVEITKADNSVELFKW